MLVKYFPVTYVRIISTINGRKRRANLTKEETLLVHGATGGVGLAAVELGRVLGAKIIATVSKKEKVEPAIQAGAHHVIILNQN